MTLARLEDRPGALVIVVEPDDQLRRLTAVIGAIWPQLPPHKGDRPDFAYHVTVARTANGAIRSEAWDEIASHPSSLFASAAPSFRAAEGSPESGADYFVSPKAREV